MSDELAAKRMERDGGGNIACASCGCEWWKATVVVSKDEWKVTGYHTTLHCQECGKPTILIPR